MSSDEKSNMRRRRSRGIVCLFTPLCAGTLSEMFYSQLSEEASVKKTMGHTLT